MLACTAVSSLFAVTHQATRHGRHEFHGCNSATRPKPVTQRYRCGVQANPHRNTNITECQTATVLQGAAFRFSAEFAVRVSRIDPRAMRLSSGELAAAIAEAIGAAMADLQRQLNDVMSDELGPAADRGTARVEEMRDAFNQRMAAIAEQLEAARRRLERATMP